MSHNFSSLAENCTRQTGWGREILLRQTFNESSKVFYLNSDSDHKYRVEKKKKTISVIIIYLNLKSTHNLQKRQKKKIFSKKISFLSKLHHSQY